MRLGHLAGLLLASNLSAGIVSYVTPLNGPPVPDGSGSAFYDLVVADSYGLNPGDAFTLDLINWSHTWIGDLRVTVQLLGQSPPLTVFDRPGSTPSNGSTGSWCGFSASQTYTFSSKGGSALPGGVCPDGSRELAGGVYTTLLADDATNSNMSSAFSGFGTAGTWRVTISDYYPADRQPAGWGFRLNFSVADRGPIPTPTPEPTSLVMVISGSCALFFYNALRKR